MQSPRVECVYFGAGKYERMARVLEASARRWCLEWEIRVRCVGESPYVYDRDGIQGRAFYNNNGWKSVQWGEVVQGAEEGARLLLIDADTLIQKNLDDVWELDFDVAITTRGGNNPINSGVMFVRVNDYSRDFFWQVSNATIRMLEDHRYHQLWESKFGGIHQASLGAVLSNGANLSMKELDCGEWNNEQTSRHYASTARIIHLLPQGRRALFDGRRAVPELGLPLEEWKRLDGTKSGGMRWDELLARVPENAVVAEVGVWKGDLSARLLDSSRVSQVHLIDPWKRGEPGTSWWESSSRMPRLSQLRYEIAYKEVQQLVSFYRKGIIYRVESLEAAKKFDDGYFDVVFIDADHSREAVLADIAVWEPKVHLGGWIGGHDYGDPRFPGVALAVREVYPDVEVGDDYTWWRKL